MKVLLCEDIKKLGWLGDVVEVSEGYARNYLLPRGLAKVATDNNMRAIAKEKAKRSEQRKLERGRVEEAAKAVEGAEAVLAAKANEQGVLFGSVGGREIAANLREQGFEVADDVVQLPEHIKQVGTHTVTLRFTEELTAAVSVVVVPEGVEIPPEPEGGEQQEPQQQQSEQQEPAQQAAEQEETEQQGEEKAEGP